MKKLIIIINILFLITITSFGGTTPQEITNLQNHYSGTISWNSSSSTVTFLSSGNIQFSGQTGFIWKVPTFVKTVIISKNCTVNGAFHTYSSCTILGKDRKTSIVYGSDEQAWADSRGIVPYQICTFQNFGGVLTIKNLTSKNPRAYHVRGWGTVVNVSYCDFIDNRGGWGNHSDGFCGGDGSVVDHCYFETGDDIIKVYFNMTIKNCKIKMIQNTVPIQFGWGSYGSGAHGIFENDTIIGDWGRGLNRPIISAAGGTYTKQLTMKNCYIQNHSSAIFELENDANINLTCNIENSFIDVNKFSSQFNGIKKIVINGEDVSNGTTKHYWDYPTLPIENRLPIVNFISPGTDTTLLKNRNLIIEVNAIDSDGSISKVDLYIDNKFLRTEKIKPYLWNDINQDSILSNLSVGSHEIKAVAVDDKGAISTKVINVEVSESLNEFNFDLSVQPNVVIDTNYPIITYNLPEGYITNVRFYIFQNGKELINFYDNSTVVGQNDRVINKINIIGNGDFLLKLKIEEMFVDSTTFSKDVTDINFLKDFGENYLTVYPNPVVNKLKFNKNHIGTIYLYSADGKYITKGQNNINNYLSNCLKGLYYVILKYKGEIIAKQTITKI